MPVTWSYAKGNEKISWKGMLKMDSKIILAIRKINDRALTLAKNLGADNPIVQQYQSRMEALVPDQYIRENKDGILQIIRSKDFEKMGYTADRDFNLQKFQGIQELRKSYQGQFEKAMKEMGWKPTDDTTMQDLKNKFIGSMGELKEGIPLLYSNTKKEGVQNAIDTLRKSNNTYSELMNVVDVMKGIEDAEDKSEGGGSHTITFD